MSIQWAPPGPNFYDDPLLSDVIIKFGDNTLHAHKFQLSLKSKYFHTAFAGKFLEAKSGVIDLGTDDDADCVRSLIKHIYDKHDDALGPSVTNDEASNDRGSGTDNPVIEASVDNNPEDRKEPDLLFLAKLFATADKYDVPTLRKSMVGKVRSAFSNMSDSRIPSCIQAIRKIYDHIGDKSLQRATTDYWIEQGDKGNLSKQFRQVVGACGQLAVLLLWGLKVAKNDPVIRALMAKGYFCQIIYDNPVLGKDMICQAISRSRGRMDIFQCDACNTIATSATCHCSAARQRGAPKSPRIGYWVREAKAT